MSVSSSKERLYLDTNIYLDHLLKRGSKSTQFLREIANTKFDGFTSYLTFSEVCGVLKAEGYPLNKVSEIVNRIQKWPNIQILMSNPSIERNVPDAILATCCQTRDALHFSTARFVSVDKIVTRDTGFKQAVTKVIPCVLPEDLV